MTSEQITILIVGLFSIAGLWIIMRHGAANAIMGNDNQCPFLQRRSLMTDFVTLVCGFGRCGSSLVMQMLDAGGVPTLGEYPAFEDDRTGLDRDPQWIASQNGKAMKLLDPQLPFGRPIPGNYKIIWLYRNHRQQSLSQAKLVRLLMGLPMGRKETRALASSYRIDTPIALKILEGLGPVLRLRFEDILCDSRSAAQKIHDHLGMGDVVAMSSQVQIRPSKCADGMEMEIALIKKSEAATPGFGGDNDV